MNALSLTCPVCRAAVGSMNGATPSHLRCGQCDHTMRFDDGILRAMPPDRQQYYGRFLADYATIRAAEGRGSTDAAFYRALPYRDTTGNNSYQWQIRARTFDYFRGRILPATAKDIADIGAGNCWLSYRLRAMGRHPVAIDISTDLHDGLGAAHHYPLGFPRVQAEFDRLPFAAAQFDMVVYNASLHYSLDYHSTLEEALRCLRPGGSIVVLDSPLYRIAEHGEMMRNERHEYFHKRYGFRSDALPFKEYLHDKLLAELSASLKLRWRLYRPWYGWKWHLRPLKARWKKQRPPSRFYILVAQPQTL